MIISLCVGCREEAGRGQVRDAERRKESKKRRKESRKESKKEQTYLRAREKGGLKGRGPDGNRVSL